MADYDDLLKLVLGELEGALQVVNSADLARFRHMLLAAKRVFIAGKGRSGLRMRAFAMRLMHLGLIVHVVDDVTTPGIAAGDVLVIGSASGRTDSLIQYAKRAKALGAQVALIATTTTSPMADSVDLTVTVRASTPKAEGMQAQVSAQPMGNLFEQALGIVLDIVTMQLMTDLNRTAEQMFARHANLE
jgi:6-phospho-3-hexuloisomerase